MTTDTRRDDFYRLAVLLSDLDRILNPLPRHEGGEYQVVPNPPPPLPPTGPQAAPTGAAVTSAAARSVGEWREQSPTMRRTSLPTSRRDESPLPLAQARPGPLAPPAAPRLEADSLHDVRVVDPTPQSPPAPEEMFGGFTALPTQGRRIPPLADIPDQEPRAIEPGGALPPSTAVPPRSTTRLPSPVQQPAQAQGDGTEPFVLSDTRPSPEVLAAGAEQVGDRQLPQSEAVPRVLRRQPGASGRFPSAEAGARRTPRTMQEEPRTPEMLVVVERVPEPPRAATTLPPPSTQTAWPGADQGRGQRGGSAGQFAPSFAAGALERFRPREIALHVQLPHGEERLLPEEEVAPRPSLSEPVSEALVPAIFETTPPPLRHLGHRLWRRGRTIGFLSPATLQRIEQRLQSRFLDRTVRRLP